MIVVAWDRAYRNTPSSPMLFRGSTQMLSALTRHFICSHRVSGASGGKKTRGDLSVTMKTQMGPEGGVSTVSLPLWRGMSWFVVQPWRKKSLYHPPKRIRRLWRAPEMALETREWWAGLCSTRRCGRPSPLAMHVLRSRSPWLHAARCGQASIKGRTFRQTERLAESCIFPSPKACGSYR